MKKLNCAVFISDVGFGHMVRQRQIIIELLKQFNKISITIFHKKNIHILKKSFGNKIKYVKNFNNIKLKKKSNGLLDIEGSKKIFNQWKKNSDQFLKKNNTNLSKFDFFISDLVPEISYYAFNNKKPCFSICHYTWDWFYKKIFKKTNFNINIIKKYTNLSSKIYFPPLTQKKIIMDAKKFTKVNFICNKISNKKYKGKKIKILIMNNGTESLSLKIKNIIPELFKIHSKEFYVSTSKLNKKMLKEIKKHKNVHLIKNDVKQIYNYIPKVSYIVARGGYNTITECLLSKKPSLLAEEKFNPEINANLQSIRKINFFEMMKEKDWTPKRFHKRLNKFIINQNKIAQFKKKWFTIKK